MCLIYKLHFIIGMYVQEKKTRYLEGLVLSGVSGFHGRSWNRSPVDKGETVDVYACVMY